jgi:hypothetical protein
LAAVGRGNGVEAGAAVGFSPVPLRAEEAALFERIEF